MSIAEVASTGHDAVLYRMVTPQHVCPFGLKSKDLLERHGFEVEDHLLESREAQDRFKAEHHVKTTPQTFIGGERVGGYDDLRRRFGLRVKDPDATSYAPVIAVFAVAGLLAVAITWSTVHAVFHLDTIARFGALGMAILALLKLEDVEKFSTMFLGYDLLARRWVRYAYVYPFAELLAGVLMLAQVLLGLAIVLALFIGTVGAFSVVKAVYIDRRDIKCACVGGSANVPLGFVALTENLAMIGMAVWMLVRLLARS